MNHRLKLNGKRMSGVEQDHELKDTLSVDVITPGHAPRKTTSLFAHTKKSLFDKTFEPFIIRRDAPGRCWICNATEQELGEHLEAHHFGIERSYAEGGIDWAKVREDYPHWDWSAFDESDPYSFVDNMEAQGILLCKKHHTGKDEGIHNLPFGLWELQRYLKDGVKFSPIEVIHHEV